MNFISTINSKFIYSQSPVNNIYLFLIGYIIGSIIFSILISKYIFKKDVRNYYSKNPGATNVGRVFGKKMFILIAFLDLSKGVIAVGIALILRNYVYYFYNSYIIFAGLGAIIGHSYPIFFKFKGGKGAATFGGVLLFINIYLGLITLFIWLCLNIITKYVSIATIITSILVIGISCIPFIGRNIWNNYGTASTKGYYFYWYYDTIIYLFISIFIIWKHLPNIKRLKCNKEPKSKIYLWFKKKF